MPVLKLVADNTESKRQSESASTPAIKTHLDIAIENGYLQDILNILISPENDVYHLSLKAEIDADLDSLWLNAFGDKRHVSEKAIAAILSVLENGFARDPVALHQWKTALSDYIHSPRKLIMLPE